MEQKKEYYAFISYKREDEKWAKWLQNKLEHYKFPTNLNGRTDLPKNIRPTFRDVTDLTPGLLAEEIDKALRSSEWLIVICSPRSAKSPWVCKEAQTFIDLGRADKIIPFVIEGNPFSKDSSTECYPEALLNLTDGREFLAANINEMGRDAAAIKVVARMFNMRFDTLWRRWERASQIRRRLVVGFLLLGVIMAISFIGILVHQYRKMQINQSLAVAHRATQLIEEGDSYLARKLLMEVLPDENNFIGRPHVAEAEEAIRKACDYNTTIIGGDNYSDKCNFSTYSPNGKYILSSLSMGCVRLVSVENGACVKYFKAHDSDVLMATFDPTGKYIVTSSTDNCIKLWNTESWECMKTLDVGHNAHFAIFSPNGKYIVAEAEEYNDFVLLDTESLKIIRSFEGHDDYVTFASFSPDSRYIVSSSADNTIKLWDTESAECLKTFYGHDGYVRTVVFSPNGKYFVSASDDKTVKLWNIGSNECLRTYMHNAQVIYASFNPDNRYIVSSSADDMIKLWNVESDECLSTFKKHTNTVKSVCFSIDGRSLVSSSSDETVVLHDLRDVLNFDSFDHGHSWCHSTAINSNGNTIASITINELKIWDRASQQCIKTIPIDSYDFVEYVHDDKCILTVSDDEEFKLWDAHTMECMLSFGNRIKNDRIMCVSVGPSSNNIVAGYYTGQIKIWNIISGECVDIIESEDRGYLESVKYSSNGKYIVATSMSNILLYDATSGECIDIIDRVSSPVISSACFTPDCSDIIYVLYDGTVEKYNLKRKRNTVIVNGDESDVRHSTISPDGRYFAYTFESKGSYGIKLIDLRTKTCVRTFTKHKGTINKIAYSADGNLIISASNDGTVKVHDARGYHKIMKQTREQFKHNPLTDKERHKYYLK